jgi:hypothetical protein
MTDTGVKLCLIRAYMLKSSNSELMRRILLDDLGTVVTCQSWTQNSTQNFQQQRWRCEGQRPWGLYTHLPTRKWSWRCCSTSLNGSRERANNSPSKEHSDSRTGANWNRLLNNFARGLKYLLRSGPVRRRNKPCQTAWIEETIPAGITRHSDRWSGMLESLQWCVQEQLTCDFRSR